MQERGAQLGLPQALMRWRQQWRGPWWLEVVQGGLWRGHPGLGLRKQNPRLRGPQQELRLPGSL